MVSSGESQQARELRSPTFENKSTEYDIYHDESLIEGYWHGILFVPRESRKHLLDLLATIRRNTDRSHKLSLKNLNKTSGKLYKCTSCWLHVGIAALIQNFKGLGYSTPTGADGKWAEFLPFTQLIRARFVLFRIKGGLDSLNFCRDYASRVETTFRMALKGGSTILSREESDTWIRSVHFDGHRHYHRRLNISRILRDIGVPPSRVRLHENIELNDDSSDHRAANAQPYDHCHCFS